MDTEIIKDKHRTETSWKQSHGINKRTDAEMNTNTSNVRPQNTETRQREKHVGKC